jgi:import inner membrane translocase subunit TIM50
LEWDKSIGWRLAVRPGAKEFLSYLSRYYEIVVFANTPSHQAHPVLDTFDPYNFAMYRLYRESTRFTKGAFVKDLSTLNRDLSKVVCVDVNPEAYQLQPENGLFLKPWHGEKDDNYLKNMTTVLEGTIQKLFILEMSLFMQIANLTDIRPLLRIVNENNSDDPYAGWIQHKEKLKQEFDAQAEAMRPKGGIASLFRKSTTKHSGNIFDYIEKIGKEERIMHEKQINKELANMKKMREDAEKKMIEDVKAQKTTLVDSILGKKQDQPSSETATVV